MKKIKRVFLLVMDSVGCGELPDAHLYGDAGSHTLKACYDTGKLYVPNLVRLGLFNVEGINLGTPILKTEGSYCKLAEASYGKDTTTGHWEISGIISEKALPTYPKGFPEEIISAFEKQTGRKVLCNKPYSGTQLLTDYGKEHIETGSLIVYTSADSVFQIAAHERIVSVEELYGYCEIARKILVGKHGVGRVIARPFIGDYPSFKRTSNRHDYSILPPKDTMLDAIKNKNLSCIGVGKINDIFAGRGITKNQRTISNDDGMEKTLALVKEDFNGLCFINLVDFDTVYGHRNDVSGYTKALNVFDKQLGELLPLLKEDDVLLITADHGCDPSTESTDHSREYIPLLAYGNKIKQGINLGIRTTFSDIGKTILEFLRVEGDISGNSFANEIL